jgi:hypothetical protein
VKGLSIDTEGVSVSVRLAMDGMILIGVLKPEPEEQGREAGRD